VGRSSCLPPPESLHPHAIASPAQREFVDILQNPIYTGDFRWHGKVYRGSHELLVSQQTFSAVDAVLNRQPRARYPRQRHAFMGLLTCARCGCAMTAERKKSKYTYYRCTAFHGRCGNAYVRDEQLAQLVGGTVDKIQLPGRVAKAITVRLHAGQAELEQARGRSSARLLERQRALKRRSIADTTITSSAGSRTRCGRGNRRNGKPSLRP
jgi:site-specific DNA recombinase